MNTSDNSRVLRRNRPKDNSPVAECLQCNHFLHYTTVIANIASGAQKLHLGIKHI